jgi:hypothetical protein
MKSKKELEKLFKLAKGDNPYYGFESFLHDAKGFIKDVRFGSTICSIKAAPSGMSRKFNFDKYNMLLNICQNQKLSWDPVYIGGCGMDMHWYLKFRACEDLLTPKELDKWNINSRCSGGKTL